MLITRQHTATHHHNSACAPLSSTCHSCFSCWRANGSSVSSRRQGGSSSVTATPTPRLQQQRAATQPTTTAAAAARRNDALIADALQNGLRVVIDCSYVHVGTTSSAPPGNTPQQWQRVPAGEPVGQQQSQQQQAAATRPQPQQRGRLVTGAFIHKEIRSMAKQIELSAAVNKRSPQPVALTVTSFTGPLAAFANHMGAPSWPAVNLHTEPLLELFDRSQVVLMSPDAQEPLPAAPLDPSKVYVIGGIVDKTVQKNLTIEFAQEQELPAYRLPVREYAESLGLNFPGASTRPILSPTDVVTALIEFNRTQDWAVALDAAVPKRKRRQHGGGGGGGAVGDVQEKLSGWGCVGGCVCVCVGGGVCVSD